jgi:hypothetical protein
MLQSTLDNRETRGESKANRGSRTGCCNRRWTLAEYFEGSSHSQPDLRADIRVTLYQRYFQISNQNHRPAMILLGASHYAAPGFRDGRRLRIRSIGSHWQAQTCTRIQGLEWCARGRPSRTSMGPWQCPKAEREGLYNLTP